MYKKLFVFVTSAILLVFLSKNAVKQHEDPPKRMRETEVKQAAKHIQDLASDPLVPEIGKLAKKDFLSEICQRQLRFIIESNSSENLDLEENLECLVEFGFDKKCQDKKSCERSLVLARSALINRTSRDLSEIHLTAPLIANRLIQAIGAFDSKDLYSPEIYTLADQLLQKYPDNLEAHNVRAAFGIGLLKRNWEAVDASKVYDSFQIQLASPDLKDFKRGVINGYVYHIIDHLNSKSMDAINEAYEIARKYQATYPNEVLGYYMLVQVFSYKNDFKNTLLYLEKGLAFGPQEDAYQEYNALYQKLKKDGKIDTRYTGLRIDLEKFIDLESILSP